MKIASKTIDQVDLDLMYKILTEGTINKLSEAFIANTNIYINIARSLTIAMIVVCAPKF